MNALELKLCDIQGRLFERSAERKLQSAAFIKAFMTGETARALDSRYNPMQWMGEEYLFEEVRDQGGAALLEPGEVFSKDLLYWIGYLYRYWHYMTGESSAKIFRQAPVETLRRNYLIFHTLAPEMAIGNLQELDRQKRGGKKKTDKTAAA